VKHLILALVAATFPLSVMAESINLNSSRSNVVERGKPSKDQVPAQAAGNDGIRGEREPALMGADSCNFAIDQKGTKFTIDEKGVRRLATEQQQKTCKTFNESRSNALRDGNPSSGKPRSGEAGIAVSDPGVPSDKNALKK
jgi:hypothetical protein